MSDAPPILDIVGLRKSFGPNEILRGIDLAVQDQESVCIIGPSGCGKTTLLRCCNRLETPDSGTVWVDGINLGGAKTDIDAMRRRIGMVFQSANLYPHMKAIDNVMLGLRRVLKKSRAEAEVLALAMLELVGLAEKRNAYPAELSGGQQQRVAIARALALGPKLMLFDEPTAALDPDLVGSVLAVMRDIRRAGMTMVTVSHEMRFARDAADRVVFVDHGVIVEEGKPNLLFGQARHARTRSFVSQLEQ
jgi:polar amino acid transport system ATP-binding protein